MDVLTKPDFVHTQVEDSQVLSFHESFESVCLDGRDVCVARSLCVSECHTPSMAFRHLLPRKDVVNQCLELVRMLARLSAMQLFEPNCGQMYGVYLFVFAAKYFVFAFAVTSFCITFKYSLALFRACKCWSVRDECIRC